MLFDDIRGDEVKMNDNDFKITLIKALEQRANTDWTFGTDNMWKVS